LFLVIGSLIYTAYSKLRPESLVSLLETQIQKNYQGSKLSIEKVDYGFNLDFDLTLKNISITRADKTLASAQEVQLKVPWWLILLDRGSAQINISDLIIYVQASKGEPLIAAPENGKLTSPILNLELPKYLMDAHYTLRAKNISIKEINGDRRFITFSKLLVREFQYGKNSAFELNIPVDINHKEKQYSSELWLFGDVTPNAEKWTLNYRGEFKTKETQDGLHFDDLVIDGKSSFNPLSIDLQSQVELTVDRKTVGTGFINAKNDELSFDLKFTTFPLSYLNLIGDEIKNPFWNNKTGQAEGQLKFVRNMSSEGHTRLSAKLNFPGAFYLGSENEIPGKWTLNFDNDKWETTFITPQGEISFFRRAVIDFDNGEVKQYSQELGFNSLELKTALLAVKSVSEFIHHEAKPFHSTFISIKKCKEGEQVVNGSFRYGLSPFEKFYQIDIQSNDRKMLFNYLSKNNVNQMNLEFMNFSWNPGYKFFAPYFEATEGTFNGSIAANWSNEWSDGKWLINFKGQGIRDFRGDFVDLNKAMWEYFDIDASTVSSRTWNLSAEKKTIKVNSSLTDSIDPALLTGSLSSQPNTKSFLTLSYPKNKKWKPVKKEVTELFWKKENI
jgi:hypothetical protein